MSPADSSWVGLQAWLPTQGRLKDGLCWCLNSLVSLTRWLGIFTSKWGYEFASLPWQGSRPEPRASALHCLWALIRPDYALISSEEAIGFALQRGMSQVVFSIQMPLYVGLLNGLCTLLCALVKLLDQTDGKL